MTSKNPSLSSLLPAFAGGFFLSSTSSVKKHRDRRQRHDELSSAKHGAIQTIGSVKDLHDWVGSQVPKGTIFPELYIPHHPFVLIGYPSLVDPLFGSPPAQVIHRKFTRQHVSQFSSPPTCPLNPSQMRHSWNCLRLKFSHGQMEIRDPPLSAGDLFRLTQEAIDAGYAHACVMVSQIPLAAAPGSQPGLPLDASLSMARCPTLNWMMHLHEYLAPYQNKPEIRNDTSTLIRLFYCLNDDPSFNAIIESQHISLFLFCLKDRICLLPDLRDEFLLSLRRANPKSPIPDPPTSSQLSRYSRQVVEFLLPKANRPRNPVIERIPLPSDQGHKSIFFRPVLKIILKSIASGFSELEFLAHEFHSSADFSFMQS